ADGGHEPGGRRAGVPELVRGAGIDEHALSGPHLDGVAADLEADGALEHLEVLALLGVDVRGGDGAVRLDGALDDDGLAAGVARGREEAKALPGDRVLDGVAGADHFFGLLWSQGVTSRSLEGGARRGNAAHARLGVVVSAHRPWGEPRTHSARFRHRHVRISAIGCGQVGWAWE